MDEGPDYRQQQEAEEMALWLDEQDAKRRMRALEIWTEMNKEPSDERAAEDQRQ